MISKYRVWHKKFGMCEVTWLEFTLDNSDKDSYPFLLGGLITQEGKAIKEARINPKTLMQSTGLKDKNGTEIFEGDVLKLHPYATSGDKDYLKCVKYELLHCDSPNAYSGRWKPFDNSFRECWIVGNIHANPELLEASHGANPLT